MDVAPRDIPADELQALIQSTRADLDAVAASPSMRREPTLRANDDETSTPGSLDPKARKDFLIHAHAAHTE